MRVVHVIPTLAAVHGGPSEVVKQLLIRNSDAVVVTTSRSAAPGDFDALAGRVHLCKPLPPRRLNVARGLTSSLEALSPFDVAHLHSVNSGMTSIAARWCTRRGVPFVLQPHGAYDVYHVTQNRHIKAVYNKFDRSALNSAQAVIVSSRREETGVSRQLDAHCSRIPLGVDDKLWTQASQQKSKVILFLGRVTKKKRVDLALRSFAASRALSDGWRLVVAGPVDDRLGFDPVRMATELGITSAVSFVGAVDRETRNALLAEAAVFVLPSEDESFGVAAAEAMAAGCACVLSNEVGLAEDFAGTEAFVASSLNVADLVDALNLLVDPNERQRRGLLARGLAERHFAWDAIAGELDRVYSAALQSGKGHRA